jgi:hypothetical protein
MIFGKNINKNIYHLHVNNIYEYFIYIFGINMKLNYY